MTEHIILAASVALRRGDRFLLVERGRPPARGQFAFPGGRLEPGETPQAAARRELMEETGLTVTTLKPFAVMDLTGDGESATVFRLHVFTGEYAHGEPVAGDDAASAGWYGVEEMKTLPATASTVETARQILDRQ